MSYAVIQPNFAIGKKNLRRLPGLYGMGQEETAQDAASEQQINQALVAQSPAPTVAQQAAAAGIVPAGERLVYQATVSPGLGTGPLATLADVVAGAAANLQNGGVIVVSTNASTNPFTTGNTFQMTIQTTQDYTSAALLKQVIDDAVNGSGKDVTVEASGFIADEGNFPIGSAPGSVDTDTNSATNWCNEDMLGLGLNNCTYVAILALIAAGVVIVKQAL